MDKYNEKMLTKDILRKIIFEYDEVLDYFHTSSVEGVRLIELKKKIIKIIKEEIKNFIPF